MCNSSVWTHESVYSSALETSVSFFFFLFVVVFFYFTVPLSSSPPLSTFGRWYTTNQFNTLHIPHTLNGIPHLTCIHWSETANVNPPRALSHTHLVGFGASMKSTRNVVQIRKRVCMTETEMEWIKCHDIWCCLMSGFIFGCAL